MSEPGQIEVIDLGVSVDQMPLLSPISFTVPSGGVLALRGANGSGKTTVLRVLAGVTRPSAGRVLVGGSEPRETDPDFRARVAGLLGPPATARNLTVLEHLQLVTTSWTNPAPGLGQPDQEAASRAILRRLKITSLADRYPQELSSGQTHLFHLAITLSRPCSVLLLDEPEQRLDDDRLALVIDLLRDRIEAGTTVVLATHRQWLVEALRAEAITLVEPDR